jgi:hypothetical protein
LHIEEDDIEMVGPDRFGAASDGIGVCNGMPHSFNPEFASRLELDQ